MPRRVEDIIVKNGRRSVRDIPVEKELPAKERPKAHVAENWRHAESRAQAGGRGETPKERAGNAENKPKAGHDVPIHRMKVTPPVHEKRHKRSFGRFKWLYVAAIVVIIVAIAGYVSSIYFSRAKFSIVPTEASVQVDTAIVATSTTTPNYLKYDISKFSGEMSSTVPASDGPYISTKAFGYVVIYNAYSAQSQRLIAGTRIANDSGLVYRLNGSVVVPGFTASANSPGNLPGKIVASVTADQPGNDYNLTKAEAVSDFKVIAYKGTPKYDGFYARLSSDISGGFAGTKKTVNPTLIASTSATLQASLTAKLLSDARAAVPKGYVLYDSAYNTVFFAPAVGGDAANSAVITEKGTLYAILFRTTDLVTKLAGAGTVAAFGNLPYKTAGLESLSFTIAKPSSFSALKGNTLVARLKGNVDLTGIIPTDELKGKLAGLTLAQTKNVLLSYKSVINIDKSTGELFPSWATRVPTDLGRITISVAGK